MRKILSLVLVFALGCTSAQTAAVESTTHAVLVQGRVLVEAAMADPTLIPILADRLQALAASSSTAQAILNLAASHATAGNLRLAEQVLLIAIEETTPQPITPDPAPPPGAP